MNSSSETLTEQLVSKLIEGELSAEEQQQLNVLLKSNERVRSQLIDHLLLDTLLREELGNDSMTDLVDLFSGSENLEDVTPAVNVTLENVAQVRHDRGGFKWLIAATLLCGIILLVYRRDEPVFASAQTIVAAAIEMHHDPLERVYLVQLEQEVALETGAATPREVRIMTMGDQYYVEMKRNNRKLIWGCNADQDYWITFGGKRGMLIHQREMGPQLRYITDLYSLNLETLLTHFLKYCTLDYKVDSDSTHLITVTPNRRWKGSPLKQATIEVDRETKVIRRLIIERVLPQQKPSKVTFTLIETRPAQESLYQPQGHLTEPSIILTEATKPDVRGELLANWFGSSAERWIMIKGSAQ